METDRTVLGTCPHISYSHILISISISIQIFIPIPLHSAASCCHCHSSAPQHCTRDTWGISHFFILAILFMPGHHFFIFPFNLGSNSFISPSRVASEHLSLHLPSDQNSQYSETAQVRCVGVPRPYPLLVQTRGGGTKVIETQLCFVRLVWRRYWIVLITSAWKSSIRRFVITEKAPTRAFSWLKAPTTAFTFKTLLRHYAKRCEADLARTHAISNWFLMHLVHISMMNTKQILE